MRTPKFTTAAQLNMDKTGMDWRVDMEKMTDLGWSPTELLVEYLIRADADQVQGLHDYIDGLVEAM